MSTARTTNSDPPRSIPESLTSSTYFMTIFEFWSTAESTAARERAAESLWPTSWRLTSSNSSCLLRGVLLLLLLLSDGKKAHKHKVVQIPWVPLGAPASYNCYYYYYDYDDDYDYYYCDQPYNVNTLRYYYHYAYNSYYNYYDYYDYNHCNN